MYEMTALKPAFKAFVSSQNAFLGCLFVACACYLIKWLRTSCMFFFCCVRLMWVALARCALFLCCVCYCLEFETNSGATECF
jgi:hypothetical protein